MFTTKSKYLFFFYICSFLFYTNCGRVDNLLADIKYCMQYLTQVNKNQVKSDYVSKVLQDLQSQVIENPTEQNLIFIVDELNFKLFNLKFLDQPLEKKVEQLKLSANNFGTSYVNKFFRFIDKLNTKIKFTQILKKSSLGVFIFCGFLYYIDQDLVKIIESYLYFDKLKCLSKFKNYIDNLRFYNQDGKIDPSLKQATNLKYDMSLGILKILGLGSAYMNLDRLDNLIYGDGIKNNFLKNLAKSISNKWNKLKGFEEISSRDNFEDFGDINLDDIRLIGVDEQILELKKIVNYIENPEKFDKSGVQIEKGILLVGPSRSGKTLLARAFAKTLQDKIKDKISFMVVNHADLVTTVEGLKTLVQKAIDNAPCVLFIDEIHLLPRESKEWGTNIVSQMLTQMSGIYTKSDSKHQVIILGATNQKHQIDNSLLQPGRFGKILNLSLPSFQDRLKYFYIHLSLNGIDVSSLDLVSMSKQTKGSSCGELDLIIREAKFNSIINSESITQELLQNSINKITHKISEDFNLCEKDLNYLCASLSGQVLTLFYNQNIVPEFLSIKKFADVYGKIFIYDQESEINILNIQDKKDKVKLLVSSYICQEVLFNDFDSSNRQQALNLLLEISLCGISVDQKSKNDLNSLKKQAFLELLNIEKDLKSSFLSNIKILNSVFNKLKFEKFISKNWLENIF